MKKVLKTKTVLFLILCAIFSLLVVPTALAEDDVLVSGDFEYYISPETAHEDYRGTVVITKYLGNDAEVVIPSEIDGKRVSSIDGMIFYKNEKLKSVQLPDTLVGIGVDAFAFCKSLESVNIPKSIKDFSPAFRGCEKLQAIVIPEGVERIEQGMFRDCTALKNVTLPNGLRSINGGAFENCASLEKIAIPDGVVEIGANAFGGCTALSEMSLPESVTYIGASAFGNTSVYNDAENWEKGVLYMDGCLIDSKREEIKGEYSVKVGTRIIAARAFSRAEGLETLKLPEGLKVICDASFDECTSLKSVELPDGLETIGDNAFRKCAMDEITIPEGVKSIGDLAFDGCKLRNVTLPNSLESIGDEAFGSNSINKVKYNGTESDWKEKQFDMAMGLSPYAKVEFAEGKDNGESGSNTSDESVEASKEVSQEVSNNEKNDEAANGIKIVSIVVIVAIIFAIAVVFAKRNRSKN